MYKRLQNTLRMEEYLVSGTSLIVVHRVEQGIRVPVVLDACVYFMKR